MGKNVTCHSTHATWQFALLLVAAVLPQDIYWRDGFKTCLSVAFVAYVFC